MAETMIGILFSLLFLLFYMFLPKIYSKTKEKVI